MHQKTLLFCVISLCVLLGLSNAAEYPSNLPRCKAGDSVECIAVASKVLKEVSNTGEGYPKLFLPNLDPLHINEIKIKQGDQSPVNIELHFNHVDLLGISQAVVSKLEGFGSELIGKKEIRINAPVISLVGNYSINGRVLILPIQGDGRCNLTLDNLVFIMKFNGKSVTKNGKEYLKPDKFKAAFTTTRLHIFFGNLFKGDKALGDNTNLFLNENWKDIFNELKVNLFDAFGQIMENVITGMFTRIPYKELFADE